MNKTEYFRLFPCHDLDGLVKAIESSSIVDDVDRFALVIAPAAYRILQEDAFLWLDQNVRDQSGAKHAAQFAFVLSEIGYYSDGFSPSFALDAIQFVTKSCWLPECRKQYALGLCRWEAVYREDAIYTIMWDFATSVAQGRAASDLATDKFLMASARFCIDYLKRRRNAADDLETGLLRISEAILNRIGTHQPEDADKLFEFGFDLSNTRDLNRAIVSVWTAHREQAIKGMTPGQIARVSGEVRSPKGMERGRLELTLSTRMDNVFVVDSIRIFT